MSVAGISSSILSQATAQPPSVRQQEDAAWRQLEQGLQSGNQTATQQAYNTLASFGPNNSGPFSNSTQAAEFKSLGQSIQAGDLTGAQQQASQIAGQQLTKDFNRYEKDVQTGNPAGGQALADLKGDFWAEFGSQPQSSPPSPTAAVASEANPVSVGSSISLQA
ncbi:MAG TPA: hypothetical protein VK763_10630 [Terriglobales bacterium]|jgi:hypothetical protein|nr:hypothetical protein [Terriglobales bacterium]